MKSGEIWLQNNGMLKVKLINKTSDGWHVHNLSEEHMCLFMNEDGTEGKINCIAEEILRKSFHKDWSE